VKRPLIPVVLLALTGVAGAVAYQEGARQRDYRAQLARGDAALRDDQTFGAIEAYSGAIALRPEAMLAHLRLAETYQRRGDLEEAAREFRRAAALDPTATRPLEELGDAHYHLQRYGRAIEAYQAFLRLDDRSAKVAYKLALALYREGSSDRALAAANQAIALDVRLAEAYYLKGLCLREKRRTSEAVQAFERAASLSPGMIPAREELADAYRALGRSHDELEQLQLLAGLDRDHVERQVAVGLAHARTGHGDVAVVTLGNALERSPDQPLIYAALGRVWLDMASTRSDALRKALEALEPVASTASATSDVLTVYGRALLEDDNPEAAERSLHLATLRFPVEPSAFLFYAAAAERLNHVDLARRALIDYGALVPNDPDLVSRATKIGVLSLRLDDADTAVEWLQRASTDAPADTRILTLLADAQFRAGDSAAAQATIARALDKDPANVALLKVKAKIEKNRRIPNP